MLIISTVVLALMLNNKNKKGEIIGIVLVLIRERRLSPSHPLDKDDLCLTPYCVKAGLDHDVDKKMLAHTLRISL